MKKWQKGIIIAALIVVISNIALYAVSGETILQLIPGGRNKPDVKLEEVDQLEENRKETITCNGITIQMVKCIFDSESTFGYSEFDISRKGGFAEGMYGDGTFSDGENWYTLRRLSTGSHVYNTELKDDGTLHIDYKYNGYNSKIEEDFIGLFNTDNLNESIDKIMLLDKYKEDNILHINDGITAVISPLGIRIDDLNLSLEESVVMKYADGTEVTCTINGKTESSAKDDIGTICWIDFYEYTKIDDLKSLIINGNEYFTE